MELTFMKLARILLGIMFIFSTSFAQTTEKFPVLTGEYLGQKTPGIVPEIFAPGIICTGFSERDITISPDGKEIYFGLLTGRNNTIMVSKIVDGKWTEPAVAQFAEDDNYFHLEPCLSYDGSKMFYLSTRPPLGKEPKPRWGHQNIWISDRLAEGSWSGPYLDTLLNRWGTQFYPSLTKDGTVYFTSSDPQTKKPILLRSRFLNGKYQSAEKLPNVINREGTTPYNAFISPDENYLIACIEGIQNEINPGFANYYVFFRDENDNWSEAIPFGEEINMEGSTAMSASVSPDGKYMFFAAQKISGMNEELSKVKTISSMKAFLNNPQNGNYDIYWVDAKVIQNLKPKQ